MRTAPLLVMLAAGCGGACLSDAARVASGWAPAERLFRGDRAWLGGDAAYSVDLGGGRILWLFGDSFVSPTGNGSRAGAPFARNSVAIQHGADPARATIDFHYRRAADGTPTAFFDAPSADTWLWPGPGARLDGGALFVFLWRVKAVTGGLGFANDAPQAVLVANPDDAPEAWRLTPVAVPANGFGVFVGTGAILVEGGWLYSFSAVEPGNHDVYLARWPVSAVAAGQLDDPEWATAPGVWTRQSALGGAAPLRMFAGHTEFSVHFDAATRQYVELQATGWPGDLTLRTAPAPSGPWSEARLVYHPPEADCGGVFTYAGKAHPELASPDLAGRVAVSYATNAQSLSTVAADLTLYFPRFVRLDVASATATP